MFYSFFKWFPSWRCNRVLIKKNKLSKYSPSLDPHVLCITPNITVFFAVGRRHSDETWLGRGSRDASERGPLCLDWLVSPHVRLTQITPPVRCCFFSHICLQSTANQPRPWPLIIHRRVTFVLYTSPVTSYLFMLFDNEPLPTETDTLWNIYWGLFPQNGLLPLQLESWFTHSDGVCDFVQSLSFVLEFVLCWGATEFLMYLPSEGLRNLDGESCVSSNHKWELCDCVLHLMFSHLTWTTLTPTYGENRYSLLKSSSSIMFFHRSVRHN